MRSNSESSGGTFFQLWRGGVAVAKRARIFGRWRGERGSAMVEFAVSVTLLVTMMLSVMCVCLGLYSYHVTSEAARVGARYAMVRGSSCATYGHFSSSCPVTSAQVQTYLHGLAFPGINTANFLVAVSWPTTGAACTPSLNPCNNPGNLVKVTVNYTFPVSIPFVPAQILTMSSTAQTVIAD